MYLCVVLISSDIIGRLLILQQKFISLSSGGYKIEILFEIMQVGSFVQINMFLGVFYLVSQYIVSEYEKEIILLFMQP